MTTTPRDGSPPVEQELKACPWCEGTRLDRRSRTDSNGNFQAYIECDDCGACGPASAWYATEEGAFKWLANGDYNWNTRISHAPAAVGRDIMREALERINLMATNHAGQFDQDPFCEYVKLGEIAGEALNAAALSASAASAHMPSREAMRQKIDADPDLETEAAPTPSAVEQVDRDAFAEMRGLNGPEPKRMLEMGVWDDDPAMHILVAHRLSARQAGLVEAAGIALNCAIDPPTKGVHWSKTGAARISIHEAILAVAGRS